MRQRVLLLTVALAVIGAGAPEAHASGTPLSSCGQTVTTSVVLTQNLHCSGAGIVVGAAGITIDLGGHRLRGDAVSGDYGIDDSGHFGDLTVKNGTLRTFDIGLYAVAGTGSVTISNLTVSASTSVGMFAQTTGSISVKSSTAAANGAVGFTLVAADSVTVKSAVAAGNGGFGINVGGTGVSISSSYAVGNGNDGITANGTAVRLKGDRADGNGFGPPPSSDGNGLGISVTGGTASGSNDAHGNDDLAECSPAALC
jgi:hypothetical protein